MFLLRASYLNTNLSGCKILDLVLEKVSLQPTLLLKRLRSTWFLVLHTMVYYLKVFRLLSSLILWRCFSICLDAVTSFSFLFGMLRPLYPLNLFFWTLLLLECWHILSFISLKSAFIFATLFFFFLFCFFLGESIWFSN